MAKPSSIPTWATDPGATVDPGPTRTATGFVIGKKAPAKWFNYLFNRMGGWMSYLNDLHNEPEFLNKPYPWTGRHDFPGGITNGYVINDWGTAHGEYQYVNEAGALDPRFRRVLLSTLTALPSYSSMFTYSLGYWSFAGGALHTLSYRVRVPRGARIFSYTCAFHNASGVDASIASTFSRITPDLTGPSPATTLIASVPTASLNAGLSTAHSPDSFDELVDNGQHEYVLQAFCATPMRFTGACVDYLDPGPRNG